MTELKEWKRLLSGGRYEELKTRLTRGGPPPAEGWRELSPLEKLLLFKLMDPRRALAFYGGLDFHEKYFLLCGFDLGALAPVIEDLDPKRRRLFRDLPAGYYDRMLKGLLGSEVEFKLSFKAN